MCCNSKPVIYTKDRKIFLFFSKFIMVIWVLSWWGDYADSKKIDERYKSLLLWKNILYIPRAMREERYPSCLEWIQHIFPISEWYTIHMLSEKEYRETNEDYLTQYDGIYIGWWNTFRLWKLCKETWFVEIIKQFINNKKPIYWGSAWAIIMGKEIHTSDDRNAVRISFEEAKWINICNDYAICCHYEETKDNEIKDYVLNYQIPVICLPEWTGIVFDTHGETIDGEKSAYKFDIAGNKIELPIASEI